MKASSQVALLLTTQFVLMGSFAAIVLFTEPQISFPYDRAVGMIIALIGLFVFSMSVVAHRRHRGTMLIKVSPTPHEHGGLVTQGVYGLIRHPIYTAAIMLFVGIALISRSLLGLLFCIVITIFLYIKSFFEETYLSQKFPEYSEYRKTTGRFLPRIFRRQLAAEKIS